MYVQSIEIKKNFDSQTFNVKNGNIFFWIFGR